MQDVADVVTKAKALSRRRRLTRDQRQTLDRMVRRLSFAPNIEQHLDGYPDLIGGVQAARGARRALATVMA